MSKKKNDINTPASSTSTKKEIVLETEINPSSITEDMMERALANNDDFMDAYCDYLQRCKEADDPSKVEWNVEIYTKRPITGSDIGQAFKIAAEESDSEEQNLLEDFAGESDLMRLMREKIQRLRDKGYLKGEDEEEE